MDGDERLRSLQDWVVEEEFEMECRERVHCAWIKMHVVTVLPTHF